MAYVVVDTVAYVVVDTVAYVVDTVAYAFWLSFTLRNFEDF